MRENVILCNSFRSEIEKQNFQGLFSYKSRFSFSVHQSGFEFIRQQVNINIMTGDLGDHIINSIPETPLVLVKDTIIIYDFCQACSGKVGLPNR